MYEQVTCLTNIADELQQQIEALLEEKGKYEVNYLINFLIILINLIRKLK